MYKTLIDAYYSKEWKAVKIEECVEIMGGTKKGIMLAAIVTIVINSTREDNSYYLSDMAINMILSVMCRFSQFEISFTLIEKRTIVDVSKTILERGKKC